MSKPLVLVIEDEADIRELVRYNLERGGFSVREADSGESGLAWLADNKPALVLLDLMLPGRDGLDICRQMKQDENLAPLPIIMLTARGEESDIITGLELGAEDYIVKPFSPRVLTARIKAVLRRKTKQAGTADGILQRDELVIHPGRHEVTVKGRAVDLTASEFGILHFLARRPGWVFTRGQIVDAVHGEDYPVTERSIDVQIVGLRKKLKKAGELIETVRGIGYRFKDRE